MRTHPIILTPGIARFDILSRELFHIDNNERMDHLHYFKGIRNHLMANDFEVWHANVDWAGSVATRSKDLRAVVEQRVRAGGKVHIIAHSMGGLDARRMLFDGRHDNLHDKVASLTTIGTPHYGTPVADEFKGVWDRKGLDYRLLGINFSGLRDLTTDATRKFNDEASSWEDDCGVAFSSYAGRQEGRQILTLLRPFWKIIHKRQGDNDGLVSVKSATWKPEYFQGTIEGDHLNELGWWDWREGLFRGESVWTFNRRIKRLYLSIADGLTKKFPLAAAAPASG